MEGLDEKLRVLTPVERFNFRCTYKINTSPCIRKWLTRLGVVYGKLGVEAFTSRIVTDHGFENFARIDPNRAVLLVANHRTLYDQFVISGRLFKLYGAHHNIYFPVRANFFYDNIFGLPVNLLFALGGMCPPIMRDKKRRQWNQTAMDILADFLERRENMVGFHPEGTRNKGSDPYAFLPGKPGCGELIYRSNPNVIPVFLHGFPSSFLQMLKRNWFGGKKPEPFVHMVMGSPLDFTAERQMEANRKTYLEISNSVMNAIEELSKREKECRLNYPVASS
jgi:1-acyl-sn-glycerol-3-phosphate acyltransferase